MNAEQEYMIQKKNVPTFYFIGVTTSKSSIMKVFPLWMNMLGRPEIVIEGIDLKIHDAPQAYRAATGQIKYDPLSLGALVTTHKIDLLHAARDMFEFLDPYAEICGEVSSISKLDGRLEGHAKDPITAGLSLDAIIGDGYFGRTQGEVLCFGAGGSGVATALHLINKGNPADRPARFIFTNRSQWRLDHAKEMVEKLNTDIQFEFHCSEDPKINDQLMEQLPPNSLVINATGMGKDTPGSPVSNNTKFPQNGVAWEFNYRGELDFLHQAESQKDVRQLTVEDGWLYFVHGWTQVIAQVLHIDLTPELFMELEKVANTLRTR
jgi:shikimate 5-dehydrogenase